MISDNVIYSGYIFWIYILDIKTYPRAFKFQNFISHGPNLSIYGNRNPTNEPIIKWLDREVPKISKGRTTMFARYSSMQTN
jgi:hypothetical protein